MKKTDLVFIILILLIFAPFILSKIAYNFYIINSQNHPIIMSFLKFSILATLGEILGLRIKEGIYIKNGFGIVPRAIVWGFLGITIFMAFRIFSSGVPVMISGLNLYDAVNAMKGNFTFQKIFTSFSVSVLMNIVFAPVMMTFHKITDTHIMQNNGKILSIFKPIDFAKILQNIDWNIQYNFIFKKTIPLFWIPAHTITFLLPSVFQVLFAAMLGIALGAILSVASLKQPKRVF